MSTFSMQHEELVPYFAVHCSCQVMELGSTTPDPTIPPSGPTPTNIVQTIQPWGVKFAWKTTGNFNYIMGGSWRLNVYLEKMGAGEVLHDIPLETEAFIAEPRNYTHVVNIAAGRVKPGVYKLTTAITFQGLTGKPGPIALFGEGPMMQFYEPGPVPTTI